MMIRKEMAGPATTLGPAKAKALALCCSHEHGKNSIFAGLLSRINRWTVHVVDKQGVCSRCKVAGLIAVSFSPGELTLPGGHKFTAGEFHLVFTGLDRKGEGMQTTLVPQTRFLPFCLDHAANF